MYIWGKGRVAGRVRLFVGNRGSGRINISPGRVGSGPRKVTRGHLCSSMVRYRFHYTNFKQGNRWRRNIRDQTLFETVGDNNIK